MLAEQRWRQVALAATAEAVVVEAQRRARQLQRRRTPGGRPRARVPATAPAPSRRRRPSTAPCRPGSRRRRAGRASARPGWDPKISSITAIRSSRCATRSRLVTKRGSSASIPTAPANFCHRFSEPTATCRGDGRGREQPVRRDRRVVGTGDAGHLAAEQPSGALERVHPDDAGEQRGADHPADPGGVALVQCGHHAVREVHAGQQVGDRHARPWSAARCRSPTSARPRPARSGRSRRGRPPGRRDRSR